MTAGTPLRLPRSHPVLAEISIDPVDWFEFQQANEDNPVTRVLGHDTPCDGRMTVYVACACVASTRSLRGWLVLTEAADKVVL